MFVGTTGTRRGRESFSRTTPTSTVFGVSEDVPPPIGRVSVSVSSAARETAMGLVPVLLPIVLLSSLTSAFEALSGRVEGPAKETLQFLQVLWRHGDRTPATLMAGDANNTEGTWPEGLGELTREGMGQQYRLGQWLRERYGAFLGPKWDRAATYIRSSDYNRTLMSALANMAGLFPALKDETFERGLPWRPVPIHTVPREIDVQLYEDISCPNAEADRERIYKESPRASEIEKLNQPLLDYLSEHTGTKVTMRDIWLIYDPLFTEKCHNSTHHWPSWMNSSIWDQVEKLYDDASRFTFHTALLRRLRGGRLVHEVLDRFASKAKGELPSMKMYAYSAHDTTLAAILATFGIFPVRFPEYATAVMLELHLRDGEYYVELYHKNSTDSPNLFKHNMEGCPSPCKLPTIKQAMSQYEPIDWAEECGLPTPPQIIRYEAAIVFLSATTILFGGILAADFFLSRRKKNAEKGEAVERLLDEEQQE